MKLRLLLLALAAPFIILATSAPVLAAGVTNPLNTACKGLAASGPVCTANAGQNNKGSDPVLEKIHVAANALALIAGAAAIIIIVYSGFMFATAGGASSGQRAGDNPARAKTARSSLIGAVVGLAIVALAWTIVTFVSDKIIKS